MHRVLKPHPAFEQLVLELSCSRHQFTAQWHGPLYRCVELEWARPEYLISGEGTWHRGSRWMRPGLCRVVHAASTERIALKESRRVYRYYGIRKAASRPRVSIQLTAKFCCLADLTGYEGNCHVPSIREMLAEHWEKLNASGVETITQACGRAAYSVDFEGLIAPSAQDRRGRNVIWFPDALDSSSHIQIMGQENLKQWLV